MDRLNRSQIYTQKILRRSVYVSVCMFATGPFNLQGCSVEVYMAMGSGIDQINQGFRSLVDSA